MKNKFPLTQRQTEVLRLVDAYGVVYYTHYMGRLGGDYWWFLSVKGRFSSPVVALIRKGYLRSQRNGSMGDETATITEKGSAYLASAKCNHLTTPLSNKKCIKCGKFI